MNVSLPATAPTDIASTTTSWIAPMEPVVALAAGVFIAMFVIQFLIGILADRYDRTHPPRGGVPMM
jgi:MFS family permease